MNELRRDERFAFDLPAEIRIGTQLVLKGRLRDLSSKSAFIKIRESVYLKLNDELGFSIQCEPDNEKAVIEGVARISRIADDGLAIYFTRMEDPSVRRLRGIIKE
jgi:hypothetical protein